MQCKYVCMCVYACMCIYRYAMYIIHIHIQSYTHTHTYIYIHIHIDIHITYIYSIHIHIHRHIYTYTYIYWHIDISIYRVFLRSIVLTNPLTSHFSENLCLVDHLFTLRTLLFPQQKRRPWCLQTWLLGNHLNGGLVRWENRRTKWWIFHFYCHFVEGSELYPPFMGCGALRSSISKKQIRSHKTINVQQIKPHMNPVIFSHLKLTGFSNHGRPILW